MEFNVYGPHSRPSVRSLRPLKHDSHFVIIQIRDKSNFPSNVPFKYLNPHLLKLPMQNLMVSEDGCPSHVGRYSPLLSVGRALQLLYIGYGETPVIFWSTFIQRGSRERECEGLDLPLREAL